ncbi:antibiotic biosynthesis monooxygenase family protein [Myroides odoratus]|uniref:putative quinol monooxygenase n=1 Tax=Myroides odoratus TaxID=256 RepID=UPI003342C2FC
MFVRIVKLTLQEDKIDDFLNHFEKYKDQIRNFPGCQFLEVYRDKHQPNIFFTYSYWSEELDLDTYKKSTLFGEVWPYFKKLFKEKAEAWSVDKYATLK